MDDHRFDDLLREYFKPEPPLPAKLLTLVIALVLVAYVVGLLVGCAPAVLRKAALVNHWDARYTPTEGDSMAKPLADLEARLQSAGITIDPIEGGDYRGGAASLSQLRIALDRTMPINGQFEVLAHEAGHFFGPPQASLSVQQVFAELVSVEVCKFYGMDTTKTAAVYLAAYRDGFPAMKYFQRELWIAIEALTGQRPMPHFKAGP